MRKANFAAIAVGASILAGIVGWSIGSNRPLQAKAFAATEAQIDTFSMMANGKDLLTGEFQDFSLVFSAPVAEGEASHHDHARADERTTAACRT